MTTPHYAPMKDWMVISGIGRSHTYDLLSQGKLVARKVGKRLLIDVRAGLEFIAKQPAARVSLKRSPLIPPPPDVPAPPATPRKSEAVAPPPPAAMKRQGKPKSAPAKPKPRSGRNPRPIGAPPP